MIKKIIVALAYFFPVVAFAQTMPNSPDAIGILDSIKGVFDIVIPLLITLALIYFLWGVAQYVMKQGDEEGQKGARQMMINGIIALFVIISVWGLVAILNTTFNIEQGGGPDSIPVGATQ